jgi:hypothetical protein
VPKHIFTSVGGFNESLRAAEDVEFCQKIRLNYKICLIKEIETIHLRDSKTVAELFKREFKRGQDSLKSLLKSVNPSSELPSVMLTGLFLALLISCCIFIAYGSIVVFFPLAFLLVMPVGMVIKKNRGLLFKTALPSAYVVSFTYLAARSFALGHELLEIVWKIFLRKTALQLSK